MNINIKSFFLFLFVCVFFFGCCSDKILVLETKLNGFQSSVGPLENKRMVYNSINSTVALTKITESGKKIFYCSGIFVNPTTIVTARHCIVDAAKIRFLNQLLGEDFSEDFLKEIYNEALNKTIDITTRAAYVNSEHGSNTIITIKSKVKYFTMKNLGKLASAEEDDIAILKVQQKDASPFWMNVSQNDPRVGDKIFNVGMPLGEPWLISEGIISQDHFIGKTKTHYYVNLYIAPGASGGPLVNAKGELIGIAHVMFSTPAESHSGLALFIELNKIKQYLNHAKVLSYD